MIFWRMTARNWLFISDNSTLNCTYIKDNYIFFGLSGSGQGSQVFDAGAFLAISSALPGSTYFKCISIPLSCFLQPLLQGIGRFPTQFAADFTIIHLQRA